VFRGEKGRRRRRGKAGEGKKKGRGGRVPCSILPGERLMAARMRPASPECRRAWDIVVGAGGRALSTGKERGQGGGKGIII